MREPGVPSITRPSPKSPRRPADRGAPVSVCVLVDLECNARAGGQVKYWQNVAAAAKRFSGELDLTVHYSGGTFESPAPSENVRIVVHQPVFSTRRLPFLSGLPAHTDLAPFHPALARALSRYEVIHTTDCYFAFSRTAARFVARHGYPLVNSVHTATPGYTRDYTRQMIGRLPGRGLVDATLTRRLHLPDRAENSAWRRFARHHALCRYVFIAEDDAISRSGSPTAPARRKPLPHGIDFDLFQPQRRSRRWLADTFGIPLGRTVIATVGRIDRGKRTVVLAEAVARLVDAGEDVHLVCLGEGPDRQTVLSLLGPRATCPGFVESEDVGRVLASADLYAHPSEIETYGMAVSEALAAGLPTLVAAGSPTAGLVAHGTTGLVVDGAVDEPVDAWVVAIAALARNHDRRAEMGAAAADDARRRFPSWEDVLGNALLPVWREAGEAAWR